LGGERHPALRHIGIHRSQFLADFFHSSVVSAVLRSISAFGYTNHGAHLQPQSARDRPSNLTLGEHEQIVNYGPASLGANGCLNSRGTDPSPGGKRG
jgi:hypothetical protein